MLSKKSGLKQKTEKKFVKRKMKFSNYLTDKHLENIQTPSKTYSKQKFLGIISKVFLLFLSLNYDLDPVYFIPIQRT